MADKSRSRAWCFTINNYTDADILRLESLDGVERLIVGREVAETGTPHLQGYVRFSQPVRFSWWKNQFPKAHVAVRRGTETQAAEYCSKEGNVAIDKGINFDEELNSSRGKRSRDDELAEILDEIDGGAKYGQVRARHRRFFFWNRRLIIAEMYDNKRLREDPDWEPSFTDR